jgi:urease accessory protein
VTAPGQTPRCVTEISDLRLAGASKLLFPRGADMTAVVLNTSGGVTGGDLFRLRLDLDPGTEASVTTQAAERLYRAQPGERGTIVNRLRLGAGARLNWLPQETIVFDRACAQRALSADLAPDAELLAVEPLVFGRHASGEALGMAHLHDRWSVRRGGTLVFADRLQVSGEVADLLGRVAGGAGAMASVLLVGPRADAMRDRLRETWDGVDAAAVSLVRPGVLFARLFAPCGFTLRRALIPALECLSGRPLPRPWAL